MICISSIDKYIYTALEKGHSTDSNYKYEIGHLFWEVCDILFPFCNV